MSEIAVSRDGADSESYVARATQKRKFDTTKGPRAFLTNATVSQGTAAPPEGSPAPIPVITPETIQDNYRRLSAPVFVTESVLPDGTPVRLYKENRTVAGDGIRDALGTDRGEGVADSIERLRKEGAVRVEGFLDREPSTGRFSKKSK